MKQIQTFYSIVFNSYKPLCYALLFGSILLFLTNCLYKQDRTTVIYGTITDQNQQPVDSILVTLEGIAPISHFKTLKTVYSDSLGNFEIVAEVPKKYSQTSVGVPWWPIENPKFQKYFKGFKIHKNDEPINDCCSAIVGEKTKYDFQLIAK